MQLRRVPRHGSPRALPRIRGACRGLIFWKSLSRVGGNRCPHFMVTCCSVTESIGLVHNPLCSKSTPLVLRVLEEGSRGSFNLRNRHVVTPKSEWHGSAVLPHPAAHWWQIYPFTEDVASAGSWLGARMPLGGGDIPEDLFAGLDACLGVKLGRAPRGRASSFHGGRVGAFSRPVHCRRCCWCSCSFIVERIFLKLQQ